MIYRILADLTVLLHLSFIVFALLGGISVLWYRYAAVLHLPAGIWVVLISFKGWICPLTPLENHWRQAAGLEGYEGGFVEYYVLPVIYPVGLTQQTCRTSFNPWTPAAVFSNMSLWRPARTNINSTASRRMDL